MHRSAPYPLLPPFPTTLVIVAVITLACFNMAFALRAGLPLEADTLARMRFLTEHTLLWQLGWLSWMCSALGLLLFCFFLLDYIPDSRLRQFAILLVGLGIAPDLSAEVLYAFVLPHLAALPDSRQLFETVEIIASQLTGTVGNGAYNIGGLLLNLLLAGNPRIPRALVYGGLPAWVFGLGLSAATALQAMPVAAVFTGMAMVWSVSWMFAVALVLFRQPARYQVAHGQ